MATQHRELERLLAIQRHVDAFTVGIVDTLPMTASWDCLELGAGAGSIAYWLAERCPKGRVVAADIDVQYIHSNRPPHLGNLEIEKADVTIPDYAPGVFDLVHARYLFCHLAARDEVLARAARWLKPGGYLLIEEPYQLPAETSPFPPVRRLMDAYERYHAARGTDSRWARGLPAALARAGLRHVMHTGNLGCMGCGDRDRWSPLIANVGPSLVAEGLVAEADVRAFSSCSPIPRSSIFRKSPSPRGANRSVRDILALVLATRSPSFFHKGDGRDAPRNHNYPEKERWRCVLLQRRPRWPYAF